MSNYYDIALSMAQRAHDMEESAKDIPAHSVECCMCGGWLDVRDRSQFTIINGQAVCNDCLGDYCRDHYDQYISDYISSDNTLEREFASQFLDSLEPEQKQTFAELSLAADLMPKKTRVRFFPDGIAKDSAYDFCLKHLNDFADYVRREFGE